MNNVETILAKIDAGGTVTQEEAELVVQAVVRACKGPYKSEKHRAEYQEIRDKMGVVGGSGTAYDIGLLDSLNRDFCGANFNDVIVQYPFDGKEHEVACPKCGQTISFRSPYFPVEG